MSALLALALATAPDAVQAERDFAAMAQGEGQWTAFRHFAAEDAVLFTPEPVDAREALEGAPDPVISVVWWPALSFVSCDGLLAVNTGPWLRAHQGRQGTFVTVWEKQADGAWRWLLDDGRDVESPQPAGEAPVIRRASCEGTPTPPLTPALAEAGPPTSGASPDGTLHWNMEVGDGGSRRLTAYLYDGSGMEQVLVHDVPAQTP